MWCRVQILCMQFYIRIFAEQFPLPELSPIFYRRRLKLISFPGYKLHFVIIANTHIHEHGFFFIHFLLSVTQRRPETKLKWNEIHSNSTVETYFNTCVQWRDLLGPAEEAVNNIRKTKNNVDCKDSIMVFKGFTKILDHSACKPNLYIKRWRRRRWWRRIHDVLYLDAYTAL